MNSFILVHLYCKALPYFAFARQNNKELIPPTSEAPALNGSILWSHSGFHSLHRPSWDLPLVQSVLSLSLFLVFQLFNTQAESLLLMTSVAMPVFSKKEETVSCQKTNLKAPSAL